MLAELGFSDIAKPGMLESVGRFMTIPKGAALKKIPLADVRAYYESKVPLGRGCRTEDVARAVLYIIEQKYETGQAVPVTGGQVMLK